MINTNIFDIHFIFLIDFCILKIIIISICICITVAGKKFKVKYNYIPVNVDELELNVNDVVELISEIEEGWWEGKLNNKVN